MYPFHLVINNETDLYQLNDGRFQLVREGKIDPIMIGFKYILLENEIAVKLQSIDIERVSFQPAIIWDRKTDTEHVNYQLMTVHRYFDSSNLNDIDLDGKQFLVLDNRHLFVTPELMQVLETYDLNLRFSEGFSNFA